MRNSGLEMISQTRAHHRLHSASLAFAMSRIAAHAPCRAWLRLPCWTLHVLCLHWALSGQPSPTHRVQMALFNQALRSTLALRRRSASIMALATTCGRLPVQISWAPGCNAAMAPLLFDASGLPHAVSVRNGAKARGDRTQGPFLGFAAIQHGRTSLI